MPTDAQWIVAENQQTTSDYLDYSCTNTRSSESPSLEFLHSTKLPTVSLIQHETLTADLNGTITGEWSLSTIGITEGLDDAFYREFFLRQVANFERGS